MTQFHTPPVLIMYSPFAIFTSSYTFSSGTEAAFEKSFPTKFPIPNLLLCVYATRNIITLFTRSIFLEYSLKRYVPYTSRSYILKLLLLFQTMTNRMQCYTVFYFCKMLYTFRVDAPPIIRSITLYLQHMVFVCYLLPAAIAAGSR